MIYSNRENYNRGQSSCKMYFVYTIAEAQVPIVEIFIKYLFMEKNDPVDES